MLFLGMSDQRLFELISRKLAGEATTAELEEFDVMLAENAAAAERFRLLQLFWDQYDNKSDADIERSVHKLMERDDFSKPDNTS